MERLSNEEKFCGGDDTCTILSAKQTMSPARMIVGVGAGGGELEWRDYDM